MRRRQALRGYHKAAIKNLVTHGRTRALHRATYGDQEAYLASLATGASNVCAFVAHRAFIRRMARRAAPDQQGLGIRDVVLADRYDPSRIAPVQHTSARAHIHTHTHMLTLTRTLTLARTHARTPMRAHPVLRYTMKTSMDSGILPLHTSVSAPIPTLKPTLKPQRVRTRSRA